MRRLPDALSILLIFLAMLSVLLPFTSSLLPLEFLEFPYLEKLKEFCQGDTWLKISNQYQSDLSQPPLLFWCARFFYESSGNLLLAARLPSIILSVFLLISVYKIGTKYFDDRIAFWWLLLLIASPLLFLLFKSATTLTAGMVFTFLACYRLQRATFESGSAGLNFLAAAVYTGLGALTLGGPVLIFCFGNYLFHLVNERFSVKEKLTDVLMYFVISIMMFGLWPLSIFLDGALVDFGGWFHALTESYRYGFKYTLLLLILIPGFFPFNIFSLTAGQVRNDHRMDQRHFLKWMRQMIGMAFFCVLVDYRVAFFAAVPMAFLSAYALAFFIKDSFYWPVALNSLLVFIGGALTVFFVGLAWLPSFRNEVAHYFNSPQFGAYLQHTETAPIGKMAAVILGMVILVSAFLLIRKKLAEAFHILLVGLMVFHPIFMGAVILPLKEQTDTPLIRFFSDYQTEVKGIAVYEENPSRIAFYSALKAPVKNIFDLTPTDSVGQFMIASVNFEKYIDQYFKSFTKIRKDGGLLFYRYSPKLRKH